MIAGKPPLFSATVTVNGRPHRVVAGQTIATLLRELGNDPDRVRVALNRRALSARETKARGLKPGDTLEVRPAAPAARRASRDRDPPVARLKARPHSD